MISFARSRNSLNVSSYQSKPTRTLNCNSQMRRPNWRPISRTPKTPMLTWDRLSITPVHSSPVSPKNCPPWRVKSHNLLDKTKRSLRSYKKQRSTMKPGWKDFRMNTHTRWRTFRLPSMKPSNVKRTAENELSSSCNSMTSSRRNSSQSTLHGYPTSNTSYHKPEIKIRHFKSSSLWNTLHNRV